MAMLALLFTDSITALVNECHFIYPNSFCCEERKETCFHSTVSNWLTISKLPFDGYTGFYCCIEKRLKISDMVFSKGSTVPKELVVVFMLYLIERPWDCDWHGQSSKTCWRVKLRN